MSSRNVDGLNAHQTKTHTYTGSNGRTNCELEILYYNVWIILPKLDELHLPCGDLPFHTACIVGTSLMTRVDNELTIFSFSLARLDKNRYGGGVLLYIRDDLSYNAMLMVPENMELPLHNCGSNHFCLCVLYSPTSPLTFTTVFFSKCSKSVQ